MQYLLTEDEYNNIVKDTRFYVEDIVCCQSMKVIPAHNGRNKSEKCVRVILLRKGQKFSFDFDVEIIKYINEFMK